MRFESRPSTKCSSVHCASVLYFSGCFTIQIWHGLSYMGKQSESRDKVFVAQIIQYSHPGIL